MFTGYPTFNFQASEDNKEEFLRKVYDCARQNFLMLDRKSVV